MQELEGNVDTALFENDPAPQAQKPPFASAHQHASAVLGSSLKGQVGRQDGAAVRIPHPSGSGTPSGSEDNDDTVPPAWWAAPATLALSAASLLLIGSMAYGTLHSHATGYALDAELATAHRECRALLQPLQEDVNALSQAAIMHHIESLGHAAHTAEALAQAHSTAHPKHVTALTEAATDLRAMQAALYGVRVRRAIVAGDGDLLRALAADLRLDDDGSLQRECEAAVRDLEDTAKLMTVVEAAATAGTLIAMDGALREAERQDRSHLPAVEGLAAARSVRVCVCACVVCVHVCVWRVCVHVFLHAAGGQCLYVPVCQATPASAAVILAPSLL